MFKRLSQQSSSQTPSVCGYPQHFIEALVKLEEAAKKQHAALVLLSIDNLAMIMSGYSMAVAEAVIGELTAVIQEKAPGAAVLRVQRDQFAILMTGKGEHEVSAWCTMIEEAIRAYSYNSRYGELHCLISAAHQMFNEGGNHVEELLARTIVALTEGDDGALPGQDISGAERREEMGIANFLGQAIQQKRIRLAYQPIIEAATGKTVHYEALLRLFSEDGKISSAGTLIPIAERMGFAPMIDKLVLSQVVEELRHAKNVSLAVNVSNHSTTDHGWMTLLKEAIDATPDIAPRLIIELTETAVHRDLKHMAFFCAEVQALGCPVALDDFGAGYTSFRQLKALSVDYI